jgi:hypothetical protein
MNKLALVIALAACGGGSTSKPASEPLAHQAPVAPLGDRLSPERFQALANEAAARLGAKVMAWGEADLDDVDHRVRFATLSNETTSVGTYLLAAGGKLYALSFDWDGRTNPWTGHDASAAWRTPPDKVLRHVQGHRGGHATVEVALAGGHIVVRRTAALEDARAGDDAVVKEFPCSPTCTKFAPDPTTYGLRDPRGPAATLDELLPKT